jgi:hypothetical protein
LECGFSIGGCACDRKSDGITNHRTLFRIFESFPAFSRLFGGGTSKFTIHITPHPRFAFGIDAFGEISLFFKDVFFCGGKV